MDTPLLSTVALHNLRDGFVTTISRNVLTATPLAKAVLCAVVGSGHNECTVPILQTPLEAFASFHTLANGTAFWWIAKELDMNAWIYDENMAPIGYGGGHVAREVPRLVSESNALQLTFVGPREIIRPEEYDLVIPSSQTNTRPRRIPRQSARGDRHGRGRILRLRPPTRRSPDDRLRRRARRTAWRRTVCRSAHPRHHRNLPRGDHKGGTKPARAAISASGFRRSSRMNPTSGLFRGTIASAGRPVSSMTSENAGAMTLNPT